MGGADRRGFQSQIGGDGLVEVVPALQQLLDPAQKRSGFRSLDHAVVVGRGHRHDLRDPERLDLLRRCMLPLDRIGERAAGDDRALPAHQARHRGDGAEPAGVGEADVRPLEVVRGEVVLPCLGDQLLVVGVEAGEVELVRRLDAGHEQRALPLALDVDGDAEIYPRRLDHGGLAVGLGIGAAHHRPLLGGLDDRPGDQVGEAHLHAPLLQNLVECPSLGVQRVDGELAERGGRRDRPALVHRPGEGGRGAAQRLCLSLGGGGRRLGSVALRREHVGLGDLAAGAGALDAVQVHAVRLSGATGDGSGPGSVGLIIGRGGRRLPGSPPRSAPALPSPHRHRAPRPSSSPPEACRPRSSRLGRPGSS